MAWKKKASGDSQLHLVFKHPRCEALRQQSNFLA